MGDLGPSLEARLGTKQTILYRAFTTRYCVHVRLRMWAPCTSTFSLWSVSLPSHLNAPDLPRMSRAARLETTASFWFPVLEHYKTDTAQVVLICPVLVVDAASNGFCAVIKQIVMQLPITRAKFLLFEEQGVVHKG
jgi:hypothetical protein